MNWAHVLLAGYIGAVIAIVVGMFRKKGWLGKVSGAVVFVVAIIAWNLFDVHYLIPRESPDYGLTDAQKFENAMLSMPVYQVLKEQEPALWQNILTQATQLKEAGKSEQQIIDAIQPQILQVQMARLQQAPDDNVIEYMKINLEQIAAVAKVGNDECFRFLFPAVKGGINPVRIIPRELMNRRMASDMSMMHAAYGPKKHTVTAEEKQLALQDLQSISPGLVQRFGPDIQIMADPSKGVGKEKVVCEMVQDLWSQVLKLPTARAAGVIRLMLSAEMQ
ncbi:topoisomerase II [Citrobacter freundii]|uniref:Topoisomerase II n=1 Tax=Citrobacter freundii TaxID=546 RepID=A0AAP6CPP6_CITFR|nr:MULTISPECIES: topoisomerase II [Citrobacter]AYL59642.1 topoisomerase II [Citrobacter freundii]EJC6092851.1 topoisomerase II [Citrobacter freundii]EKV1033474.1 topoisomerase II [Citrobacter freundii]EKW5564813.1 topoisomerase II [Citrobacter freundii]EKX6739291.1 topoisomerase II [Citrobacter freundii]